VNVTVLGRVLYRNNKGVYVTKVFVWLILHVRAPVNLWRSAPLGYIYIKQGQGCLHCYLYTCGIFLKYYNLYLLRIYPAKYFQTEKPSPFRGKILHEISLTSVCTQLTICKSGWHPVTFPPTVLPNYFRVGRSRQC